MDTRITHRVSARDSGKPMVDAAFGEVMVTCEKIWWLVKEGRQYLLPEKRKAGAMVRILSECVAAFGAPSDGQRRP